MMSCFKTILIIYILIPGGVLEAILPLRDQWGLACNELSRGNALTALGHFHEFDRWYGSEAESKDPDFREGWIRLWGLAALEAGRLDEAAQLLEMWLAENPQQAAYRAFIRFQLVGIHRSLGDPEKSAAHRDHFLEAYPHLPECVLLRWCWADEAISRQEYEVATSQLMAVTEHDALADPAKYLAKAALALVKMACGEDEAALELLQGPKESTISELRFWRALAAPSLAKRLIGASLPEKALRTTAWFGDPSDLLHELGSLRAMLGRQGSKPASIRQGIWTQHWLEQVDRLRTTLSRQAEEERLMVTLYALKLRALREAEHHKMTDILGEAILRSPTTADPALRPAAYKAIIQASIAMKDWGRAEIYGTAFLEKYPDDPALPEILVLNARAAAARKEWNKAIAQLDELLKAFPGHRSGLSWRMLLGDWLLQSGNPESALAVFTESGSNCPPAWKPYIEFQQGRCHEALRKWDASAGIYRSVRDNTSANSHLRESASVSLLKLLLKTGAAEEFEKSYQKHRKNWLERMHSLVVENVAAMFYERTGAHKRAISAYEQVASQTGPESEFAREQLSRLYRKSNDMERLHRHAITWIESGLLAGNPIPDTPFLDCLHYQMKLGKAAYSDSLLRTLLENLEAQSGLIPAGSCLELIERGWNWYGPSLPGKPDQFDAWMESGIDKARLEENWLVYASFQMYFADRLESGGRVDSADTRRIEVLQAVDTQQLGEDIDYVLSRTADKYDFPNAVELLETFIESHHESRRYPEALFRLARRHRLHGKPARAREELLEILTTWPDATVHTEAALLYAQWSIDEDEFAQAANVLEPLLKKAGLGPEFTAQALMLRAEADFQTSKPERGFLGCLRILTLYPDIQDKTKKTLAILKRQLDLLPDGPVRREFVSTLRTTLQADQLNVLELHET